MTSKTPTSEELCQALLDAGYQEFPASHGDRPYARCFALPQDRRQDWPECQCNDKPAPAHWHVWDFRSMPGVSRNLPPGVELDSAMENAEGLWGKPKIYSIEPKNVIDPERRNALEQRLLAMLRAFVAQRGGALRENPDHG